MMRHRILGLVCAASLAAGAARAQSFYLGHATGDSALGVPSGGPIQVDVRESYGAGYYQYLYSARLTLHYDPAAVHVLGLKPSYPDSIVAVDSSVAGAFTFQTGGTCVYGTDVSVAKLQLQLDPAATSGSVVYLTADSAYTTTGYYCGGSPTPLPAMAMMTSLCTATSVYGDVDDHPGVDSRDALITLSAAVGLPVSGFNLGYGDVDGDGLVNSRDALFMLSYSIDLPTGSLTRTGMGIPVACPGRAGAGEQLVLRARGSYTYYDTIGVVAASETTLTMVPGPYQPVGPRLAADGVSIVATCSVSYVGLCRVQTDGSGYHTLFGTDGDYGDPDWNPAGDSIAFVQYVSGARLPTVTDSAGGGMRSVTPSTNGTPYYKYAGALAWNRTGTAIAWVRSDGTIWTAADSASAAQVPITGVADAQWVRWSPGGDSLAFTRSGAPGIWVVAAAGGTPAQRTSFASLSQTTSLQLGFDWGPQGIIFASEASGRMGLWLLAPSGRLWRVTSGPHVEPSFRRNP